MPKVVVLEPDTKFLGASGMWLYPEVGDIIDIHHFAYESDLKAGNVKKAGASDIFTPGVKWSKPHKSFKIPVERPRATLIVRTAGAK